ncbi:MAG: alcohol dehydrogenase catalytic domain-containing protein [Bryobacteraceae bacterium]
MNAVILKAAGQLALEQLDRPEAGPNRVLVRVTHSGICGTDLGIFSGRIPVKYPRVMGHEIAGEVIEGGDSIKAGTRVLIDPAFNCGTCYVCKEGLFNLCPNGGLIGRDTDGGFAEYLAVPRKLVFPLPDNLDNADAPLLQVMTTCLHGQRRITIRPGDTVVVLGLGVGGMLHLQLAKAAGAKVVGVARSAWKRGLAQQLGADLVLPSDDKTVGAIKDYTEGRGADIVIECTGKLPVLSEGIAMARPGATILLFGISSAKEGALPFYDLYFKELTVQNGRAAVGADFQPTIDLASQGKVQLKPLITHRLPITEAVESMKMLENDVDGRMKIILENSF